MEPKAGGIITAIDTLIPGGIANIFNIGLGAGAILAFGTIIYAGILYSIAGDDASKQKEAKAWILAAVKGLVLLAFGVVLINIVNPGLRVVEEIIIRELKPIDTRAQQLTEYQKQERIRVREEARREYVVPENPVVKTHIINRLKQGNPLWGNMPYGNCQREDSRGLYTYTTSACGPAAIAMAIRFHTGNILGMAPNNAVVTIGNIAVARGYRVCGHGTAWAAIDNIPELPRFKLESTRILGQRSIANCLRDNGVVIAVVNNTKSGIDGDQYNRPIFTTGGHYIVISGINEKENRIYIVDSGPRNVLSSEIPHFLKYNEQSWCIKE